MKIIIYFWILIFGNFQEISGTNGGNCAISKITSYYWNYGYVCNDIISDNSHAVEMLGSYEKLQLINTVGYYLSAHDTGYNSIEIFPKNIEELDKNTGTTPGDITAISADFTFNCKNGNSTLTYLIIVMDYNQHEPEFQNKISRLNIPKTVKENDDLSRFNNDIIVEDLDFSNKFVEFSIQPEDVFICETEVLENKKYRAIIRMKNITNFDTKTEYTLIATDSGNYPGFLSSNITFKGHYINGANLFNLQISGFILISIGMLFVR